MGFRDMGTLAKTTPHVPSAGLQYAYVGLSVVLAFPLLGLLGGELLDQLQAMSTGEAISVFGIVGGAAGLAGQLTATHSLEKVDRPIHIAELAPAVVASVFAIGLLTYLLLPPQFTFIRQMLQSANQA